MENSAEVHNKRVCIGLIICKPLSKLDGFTKMLTHGYTKELDVDELG